jgi:hypothetical protein
MVRRIGVIYVIRTIFHNENYGNILSLEVWVEADTFEKFI